MGKTVAIVSGKGGVGKSTITSALGAAFAAKGKRVLAIDLDAGLRSLDIMLGISSEMIYDFSDLISGSCEWKQTIYPCSCAKGLYVVPAPSDPAYTFDLSIVSKHISEIKNAFDYVILDSPAGLGNGFETAAKCAQTVLVTATADPVCVRDAAKVNQALTLMGKEEILLIVNRARKSFFKKGLMKDLDEVIDTAGIRLISLLPELKDIAVRVNSGNLTGSPSSFSKEIGNLAERLEGRDAALISI